jgi:hypothetical protein
MPILTSSSSATKGSPSAPNINSASDLTTGGAVSVAFSAPSFSKLPITSYTVTASPGGATGTGSSSPITVSGLSNGTAYTFTVTATSAAGTSSSSSASSSVSPTKVYAIGEAGPAGGIVFYDAGSTLSWGRYLEAASSNSSSAPFSGTTSNTQSVIFFGSGTSTGIGTGLSNTLNMMSQRSTNFETSQSTAASVARGVTQGGGSWFLPSRDELSQLHANRGVVGGFPTDYYWSSSESSANGAWSMFFTDGLQTRAKSLSSRVRAIRAFS